MPGLDALRGIAILSVLAYHGLKWSLPAADSSSPAVQRIGAVVSSGWLGVNLFFVLSGFLITGILIDTRSRSSYWRNFYVRRILRIFPLYLLTLLVLRLVLDLSWAYVLVCLLCLANFAGAFKISYSYGPLWSLAVEEQFYLLWPLLVRRLRLRTLALLCLGSIILSPLMRATSVSGILPLGNPYSTTWFITDNLAFGIFFAVFLRTPAATVAKVRRLTLLLGISGLVLLAAGARLHLLSRASPLGAAFQFEPFLLLFSCLLLLALQFGEHPVVLRLTAPLRFYGYISYGLYLTHLLGFRAYDIAAQHFHAPSGILTVSTILVRFTVVLAGTTLVCLLSRHYFEEYFLRLKGRLAPYSSAVPSLHPRTNESAVPQESTLPQLLKSR